MQHRVDRPLAWLGTYNWHISMTNISSSSCERQRNNIFVVAVMSTPSVTTLKATGTGWKTKVLEKRAEFFSKIPQQWRLAEKLLSSSQKPLEASKNDLIGLNIARHSKVLSERESAITENYQVSQLLDSLAAREFTALEVTVAFSKRAAIAHQLVDNILCTVISVIR